MIITRSYKFLISFPPTIGCFTFLFTFSRNLYDQQPVPVKVYQNADINKEEIFIDNKGVSGIYCFTNLINNKQYVGSAVDIRKRMYQYYNDKRLMASAAKGSIISKALLKYGYSAFSLEIFEYCDAKDLMERESYYIRLLKPEYNILQEGFTRLGIKHTDETRKNERSSVWRKESYVR